MVPIIKKWCKREGNIPLSLVRAAIRGAGLPELDKTMPCLLKVMSVGGYGNRKKCAAIPKVIFKRAAKASSRKVNVKSVDRLFKFYTDGLKEPALVTKVLVYCCNDILTWDWPTYFKDKRLKTMLQRFDDLAGEEELDGKASEAIVNALGDLWKRREKISAKMIEMIDEVAVSYRADLENLPTKEQRRRG
jgi:hypothetical protein